MIDRSCSLCTGSTRMGPPLKLDHGRHSGSVVCDVCHRKIVRSMCRPSQVEFAEQLDRLLDRKIGPAAALASGAIKPSGVLSTKLREPYRVRILPDDGSSFLRWHDGSRTGQVGRAIEESWYRVTVEFEGGERKRFVRECLEVVEP